MNTCKTCEFWESRMVVTNFPDGDVGYCRRDPPKVNKNTGQGQWPLTQPDDWCGEYSMKMDEEEPST